MTAAEHCDHPSIELSTEYHVFEHPDLSRWYSLVILARCIVCRVRFSWQGFGSGQPSPHEATTTADGYELRVPILPAPGGIVGVLKSAGLENLLTEDGPRRTARPGEVDPLGLIPYSEARAYEGPS